MKNFNYYNKKGITLMVLIITIIVLMILAGTSIAMLSGDNGLINKAIDAKKTKQIADETDKIESLVQSAIIYGGDGTVNNKSKIYLGEKLEEEFGDDENFTYDNEKGIVTTSSVRIVIPENGETKNATEVTIFKNGIKSKMYCDIDNYELEADGLKIAYGYITNIEEETDIDTFKQNLPEEYTVWSNDLTEEITEGNMMTGYTVKDEKNNIVGVCIIFGDVFVDGIIDLDDAVDIAYACNRMETREENYFLVAADVNDNGIIEVYESNDLNESNFRLSDMGWIMAYDSFINNSEITQNRLARDPSTIEIKYTK